MLVDFLLEIPMSRLSKSARIKLWLDRLNRFADCHQTTTEFCAAEGVSAAAFYHWRRRLAPSVTVPKQSRKPKPQSVGHSAHSAFTELKIPRVEPRMAVVGLPGGVTIELGTEPDTVAAIVQQVLTHAIGAPALPNATHSSSAPCSENGSGRDEGSSC